MASGSTTFSAKGTLEAVIDSTPEIEMNFARLPAQRTSGWLVSHCDVSEGRHTFGVG
jgi:hypothetical protein